MSIEKIREYVHEYGRNKRLRRVLIFFLEQPYRR